MRIYYIFNIKEEFYELYKDYPKALYNIFYEIYEMNKKEIDYGFGLFRQITLPLNKEELDHKIYDDLKDQYRYTNNKDEHIINNIYYEEVSIMKVKNTHIVINTIQSYTEFFKLLDKYNHLLFTCDFTNEDYFFLSNIKTLV